MVSSVFFSRNLLKVILFNKMSLISCAILNESAKPLLGKHTNRITIPGRVSEMTSRKCALNLHRVQDGAQGFLGFREGATKKPALCSELGR